MSRLAVQLEADNTEEFGVGRRTLVGGRRVWQVRLGLGSFGEHETLPLAYMKAFLQRLTACNAQTAFIARQHPDQRVPLLLERARVEAGKLFGLPIRGAGRQSLEISTLLALVCYMMANKGATLCAAILLPPGHEPHPGTRFDFGALGTVRSSAARPVVPGEGDWFPAIPERLRIRWGIIRRLSDRRLVQYEIRYTPENIAGNIHLRVSDSLLPRFAFLYDAIYQIVSDRRT